MLSNDDVADILALTSLCPQAEQLLVTGEVSTGYFNNDVLLNMSGCNAVVGHTLFLLTYWKTIKMVKYNSQQLWQQLPQKRLSELFIAECHRLGVRDWTKMYRNFYEGIFHSNKMFGKYVILDDWHETMYVNSVLLFKKDRAFGFDLSQFFSQFSFHGVELHSLSKEQEEELQTIRTSNDYYPTTEELIFLQDLFIKEKENRKIIPFGKR
jgi:hypothetical protein